MLSLEEAHELGKIGKEFPNCHVNLIPVMVMSILIYINLLVNI